MIAGTAAGVLGTGGGVDIVSVLPLFTGPELALKLRLSALNIPMGTAAMMAQAPATPQI